MGPARFQAFISLSSLSVVSKSLSIAHAADQSKLGGPTTLRVASYDPEFEATLTEIIPESTSKHDKLFSTRLLSSCIEYAHTYDICVS